MRRRKTATLAQWARDPDAVREAGLKPPPTRLFDLKSLELVYGGPSRIFSYRDFRAYQRWMGSTILQQNAIFLAAEMGLGKTAAVLWAIRGLLEIEEIKCVLIVAPLNVADLTWPEEIAKWDFARPLTYTVITGDENERLIAVRQKAQIHIVNRENVVWLHRYWGRRWPYDMLVYDEASRLQEGSKKTKPVKRQDGSKGVKRLSGFGALTRRRYSFKKVVELSGTPAPGGLISLWGPIYLLDQGRRLYDSRTKYIQRWFDQSAYDYSIKPHEWSHDEIMERISDVFYALKEKDYLTLPPLITTDHWVELPSKAMETYRRLKRDMVLEEYDIEAVNQGVLTNKLLQLANGSLYMEDGSDVKIHEAKLDKLESIMAEAMGRPVLVGYEFRFDIEAIKKRFPYVRVFGDSKSDKRDWDAGRIKMMLTHPASAGHGLNLQFGGNIQVWYGLTWSLELYLQFLKRLHRSGQLADRVFLHRILARGTIDEGMLAKLDTKGMTQDGITDFVRVYLEEERELLAA